MKDEHRKDWDAKIKRWSADLAALQALGGRAWTNQETRLVASTLSSDEDIFRLAIVVGSWYASDFEDVPAPRRNYPPTFAQWLRELVEEKTGGEETGGDLWDITVRDFVNNVEKATTLNAALDRVAWDELAERCLAGFGLLDD